jgi:hypothetical protein
VLHRKILCCALEASVHLGETFYFVTVATLLTIVIGENFIVKKIVGERAKMKIKATLIYEGEGEPSYTPVSPDPA